MEPFLIQVTEEDGKWKLSRAGVRKRVTMAIELDRDAKSIPKEGHGDKRRMDDFDSGGNTKEGKAVLAMRRLGTKRTRLGNQ